MRKTRSSSRLNFGQWRQILMGRLYRTCLYFTLLAPKILGWLLYCWKIRAVLRLNNILFAKLRRNDANSIGVCGSPQVHAVTRQVLFYYFSVIIIVRDWLCGSPSFLFSRYRNSFPGVKRPEREVYPHLAPRFKNEWSLASTPTHPCFCAVMVCTRAALLLFLFRVIFSYSRQ